MSSLITIPKFDVKVDGMALSNDDAQAIDEIRVHQYLSLPTLCEISFLDTAGSLAEANVMLPGATLDVFVEGADIALFKGEITALNFHYGPSRERRIYVRAYDLLHRLRKRQPVSAHVQLNPSELASALVADLGISVEAHESGPLVQKLVQFCQSDLEFISEVTERYGLYFTLRDEVLHLATLEGFGEVIPLALGSSLVEARVDVNTNTACQSVETTAWNPWLAAQHSGRADMARSGRKASIKVSSTQVGGSGERIMVDQLVQDDNQADGIAQGELDRRVADEVTLWGVAEGDVRLRPGAPIEVSGIADPLAGRYVITSVKHIVNNSSGYISELDTTAPQSPARLRATITTLGIVSNVDDPEQLGRIRVTLATYEDIETDWLDVLLPGAGPNKGVIALPDIDDQVLVLLLNEDPAQAIVLGGLYGSHTPPDTGVDDGRVRRFTFITPGGQRIRLDDVKKTVDIRNKNGCYFKLSHSQVKMGDNNGSIVKLSPKGCQIHAETDLEIGAPGQTVTISGDAINFERA